MADTKITNNIIQADIRAIIKYFTELGDNLNTIKRLKKILRLKSDDFKLQSKLHVNIKGLQNTKSIIIDITEEDSYAKIAELYEKLIEKRNLYLSQRDLINSQFNLNLKLAKPQIE